MDIIIRIDADDVAVECGMMDLAQGKAILNHGIPGLFIISDDMGGIQQFGMLQPA
jgi:hypothetical protein